MTLHLTRLTLNMESRDVRRDLADPYDMHRTLARVAERPSDRSRPFLWRWESSKPNQPQQLLVQAEESLAWEALPPGYTSGIEHRSWDPNAVLAAGRRVRFRVVANPTVSRVPAPQPGEEATLASARGRRKRLGLRSEPEQLNWLQRQCTRLGLVEVQAVVIDQGLIRSYRKPNHTITVCVAQFDGIAMVSDPSALAGGLRSGIGHARMLGLGLVTVSPVLNDE
jgi:CRISPR system Cascade subunit CasE